MGPAKPSPPRVSLPQAYSEPNIATAPHTPIPSDAPTSPPPAMPMPPPRGYEAPRPRIGGSHDAQTLVGLGRPLERRPVPANPPPPESVRPGRASEPPPGQVVLGKGKWAMSMPSAVAMALIACVGGAVTAWINKPNAGDPAAIAKAIRDEMAVLRADLVKQNDAIVQRVNGLDTKVDRLQDSQDRLRDRFNERSGK